MGFPAWAGIDPLLATFSQLSSGFPAWVVLRIKLFESLSRIILKATGTV